MSSSRRLRLTQEARDDLRHLLRYSLQTWGRPRRDAYRILIDRAFRELANDPELGRSRDEVSLGLRSFPVGQHIVYYRVRDDVLIVSRITHRRQDIEDEG